jgi:hypothetical protein
VELPIRKSFKKMSEEVIKKKTDTIIYLRDNDFDRILSIFDNRQHVDNEEIDCRMLIQYDSVEIAFGYPDIFMTESNDTCIIGYDNCLKRIQVGAHDIYYLKSICGFYNSFSNEELLQDKLISKWGFPPNYCDMFGKGIPIDTKADITIEKIPIVVSATRITDDKIEKIVNVRKIVIKKEK